MLCIGPKDDNPVPFYVHREKLVQIPYFAAALRKDSFIEGREGKVNFEEEDPILFRRVVEFIYEGDFFPRLKVPPTAYHGFEVPLKVKSTSSDSEEEDYVPHLSVEVESGAYLVVAETHQLFMMLIKLLCVADRYLFEDLVEMTFRKLKHFPIGTKEVVILIQYVVGSIPETRGDIHKFLADQVYFHLPRLGNCPKFTSLLENETSILGQGLVRLIIESSFVAQGRYLLRALLENGARLAVCTADVTVDESKERYGSDDGYPVKFGAAKTGEILISNRDIDPRYIICGQHILGGPTLAFPVSSFMLLGGASLPAWHHSYLHADGYICSTTLA